MPRASLDGDAVARVFEFLRFDRTSGKPLGALGRLSDWYAMRAALPDGFVWRALSQGEICWAADQATANCSARIPALSAVYKPGSVGEFSCIRPARKTPTGCTRCVLAELSLEKIRTEGRLLRSNSKRPGVIRSSAEAEAAACSQRQSNNRTGSS